MNRPFNLEIERELLRAAEENPGQGLVLGPDGIAKPAEAGLIQAEAMEALAAHAGRAEVAAEFEAKLVGGGVLSKGEPALIRFAEAEAAGPVAGDLAGELVEIERLLSEACWTIPDGNKARLNVTRALGLVYSSLEVLRAKPEPAGVDWAVVGPKLAEAAKDALLLAVRRQADGGDLLDFQDSLRTCAHILRPFLRYA